MMRTFAMVPVLLLIMALLGGCITIQDHDDGDGGSSGGQDMEDEGPSGGGGGGAGDGPSGDDGSDIPDDTEQAETYPVVTDADWTSTDHRFRIPFAVQSGTTGDVQLTMEIRQALDQAGLDWVGPGKSIDAFDPDPASALLVSVQEDGTVNGNVPVDAVFAGVSGLRLAFSHDGSAYMLYVDDLGRGVEGGPTTSVSGSTVTAERAQAQWQGTDLWGVVANSQTGTYPAGKEMVFNGRVENDGRFVNGAVASVTASVTATTPADWLNVTVDPENPTAVRGSPLPVSVQGRSPEDASGSEQLTLHIRIGGTTVDLDYTVNYLAGPPAPPP